MGAFLESIYAKNFEPNSPISLSALISVTLPANSAGSSGFLSSIVLVDLTKRFIRPLISFTLNPAGCLAIFLTRKSLHLNYELLYFLRRLSYCNFEQVDNFFYLNHFAAISPVISDSLSRKKFIVNFYFIA